MTVNGSPSPRNDPPRSRLVPGTVLVGRFQVGDLIGTSPLAETYLATEGDKGVSIKLLHPDLVGSGDGITVLEQSSTIATQLEHKNIAQSFGFFVDDAGNGMLVGELVDGSTLREMLQKKVAGGKAFSLKGAYNVIAHVCNALGYAHGAMVHGTLTLDSVMVNAAGRVKLTDFGLMQALRGLGRRAAEMPTVAPEVWAGSEPDRRADLYSVGVILFELLVGRPPAHAGERPSQLVAGLPPSLDAVIERCLAPQPASRFADAQELKQALHGATEKHIAPSGTPTGSLAVTAEVSSPSLSINAPEPARPRVNTPPPPPSQTSGPRPPSSPSPSRSAPPPNRPAPAAAPTPTRRPTGPQGRAAAINLDSALSAVDESQERWLIQKDKLDFGPYRISEVKHQIEKGQILGDHTIVDMENGERRRVKDHPILRDLVREKEGAFAEKARLDSEAAETRASRRRVVTMLGIIGVLIVLAGGGVTAWVLTRPVQQKERIVYKEREGDDLLKGIEITMKVDPPAAKTKKTHSGHHSGHKNANGEFSDTTNLGDATGEGGDETLGQDVVQKVMASNFGVLKGCVLEEKRRNSTMTGIEMDFIIKGTGQVSAVKVNGSTSSPVASCMYGKMQSVAFPKFNGSKTHASFSLALK